MINIYDRHNCCGCSACVQSCPQQCMSFYEDSKGFRYPLANKELCIDCGLCEKVCPMLNRNKAVEPQFVCAAMNPSEEVRLKSSSGGLFTMLAGRTLSEKGVVFGARFNDKWEVVHDYVDGSASIDSPLSALSVFRGAKYSQSIIGESYKQTRDFLENDKKVLFSGTGCQIAGLKLFLRKEYENLTTVEIACHGVPSPKVWKEYVKKVSGGQPLTSIVFRDKRNGWNGYGLSFVGADGKEIKYEKASNNDFMRCFLNDLCVRPSCSNCPAKAGASGADILIGDFWGIDRMHPEMHDNKGCSLVIAHTAKGKRLFKSLGAKYLETTHEEAYRYNPCIVNSSQESRYAPIFWYYFGKYGIEAAPKTLELLRNNKIRRILALIYYKYIKGRFFHTI